MDRLHELERRLRENSIELSAKRQMLRTWRARNPNANTLYSFAAGVALGVVTILVTIA